MQALVYIVVGLAILTAIFLGGKRRPPRQKLPDETEYLMFYDDH